MNLTDYQIAAQRTMLMDQPKRDAMMNAALGLCGEAAEIAAAHWEDDAAHVLEECGDAAWYCAQMCWANGYSLEQLAPHDEGSEDECLKALWVATGKLADGVKKEWFHQKHISVIDRWHQIDTVLSAIDTLLGFYGFTLEQACGENNVKLLKRHANGFTTETANAYADRGAS